MRKQQSAWGSLQPPQDTGSATLHPTASLDLPLYPVLVPKQLNTQKEMAEAEKQTKQLDSVTDVVQETEVDAAKAEQAMTALSSAEKKQTTLEQVAPGVIHKEDVSFRVYVSSCLI